MRFLFNSFYLVLFLCFLNIFGMEKENSNVLNQFLGVKPLEDIVLDYIGHEEWYHEKTLAHAGPISSVAISADSSVFVTAFHNIVKLWDYNSLNCIKTIALPKELRMGVMPVAVTDDPKEKAEHVTYYRDLPSYAIAPNIQSVGISRNNKYLAMVLDNRCVEIRDLATEKRLRHFLIEHSAADFKSSISFSPDNKFLCVYGYEENIKEYEFIVLNLQAKSESDALVNLRFLKTLPVADDKKYKGNWEDIGHLWDIFSGNSFFASGLFGPSTSAYSYSTFKERIISCEGPYPGKLFISSLFQIKQDALKSSDLKEEEKQKVLDEENIDFKQYIKSMEKLLKYCSPNGDDRKYINEFNSHGAQKITTLACSPDGRYILTGSEDSTVKVWKNQRAVMSENIAYKDEFKVIELH